MPSASANVLPDISQHLACFLTPLPLHTCCLLCLDCPSLLICLANLPFKPQLIYENLKGFQTCQDFPSRADASSGLADYQVSHCTTQGGTSYIDPWNCATWQLAHTSLLFPSIIIFIRVYCNDLFICWPFFLDSELLEDSAWHRVRAQWTLILMKGTWPSPCILGLPVWLRRQSEQTHNMSRNMLSMSRRFTALCISDWDFSRMDRHEP